jgi:hypothetical protein
MIGFFCFNSSMANFFKIILGKKIFIISGLVFFLLAGLLYSNRSAIYDWLYDFKLVPIKETFTELYFANHLNLPKQLIIGNNVTFSFVIHNLEGQDMAYPYNIYIKDELNTYPIEQSTVVVKKDEYRNVDISYSPTINLAKGMVVVELTDLHQELHFLLGNNL